MIALPGNDQHPHFGVGEGGGGKIAQGNAHLHRDGVAHFRRNKGEHTNAL